MRTKTLKILLGASCAVNALAVGLAVFAAVAVASVPAASSVAFSSPPSGFTAAMLASAPDSAAVEFGPVEIALKEGEEAAIQFSVVRAGGQANFILTPLHDRSVVAVRQEGMGLAITALSEGEAVLQTLAEDGIRNLAVVRVSK